LGKSELFLKKKQINFVKPKHFNIFVPMNYKLKTKVMKTIDFKKGTIINAGNFQVSIGTYNITDVAIFSKHTGKFVQFKNIKKGSKLSKLKRKFKLWLDSDNEFTFRFMQPETTIELIKFLKK
jgi:hypothetical protein